ncbi:hypothetical protein TNIN_377681 [Trichonephila inaurata madagascariensis]|uniref:Uncharacterized protein n=1 Tax=Trichonephila inaurata madagascariensis TaxID=2747483 RepID=A0A8X6YGR1_9ARAC|nr:hypothetical protein TNIN_377681 [Trichonephila inaurata madagascariensis]
MDPEGGMTTSIVPRERIRNRLVTGTRRHLKVLLIQSTITRKSRRQVLPLIVVLFYVRIGYKDKVTILLRSQCILPFVWGQTAVADGARKECEYHVVTESEGRVHWIRNLYNTRFGNRAGEISARSSFSSCFSKETENSEWENCGGFLGENKQSQRPTQASEDARDGCVEDDVTRLSIRRQIS